jgi:hypothetical protein
MIKHNCECKHLLLFSQVFARIHRGTPEDHQLCVASIALMRSVLFSSSSDDGSAISFDTRCTSTSTPITVSIRHHHR